MSVLDSRPKTSRRKGKKGRKYGRKNRNGKPFGVNGGCGCAFCRASGLNR
jgi:hypothetical protein